MRRQEDGHAFIVKRLEDGRTQSHRATPPEESPPTASRLELASASRGVHCEKPPQMGQNLARIMLTLYSCLVTFRRTTSSVSDLYMLT